MMFQNHSTSSDSLPFLSRLMRGAQTALIVIVSLFMIALPLIDAAARKLFHYSINGAVPFVQHLTLWVCFAGALIATRMGSHLAIATGEFIPAGKFREASRFFIHCVAAAVTVLFAYSCCMMLRADSLGSNRLFQVIPEWIGKLIMPIALVLMAFEHIASASSRFWGRLCALLLALAPLLLGLVESGNVVWIGNIGKGIVALATLLGAPLYVGMNGLAAAALFADQTPIAGTAAEFSRVIESPTLPAIPLLTLCGFLLAEGGASTRLMAAARACLGFIPGGIAIVVTIICAGFTTLTGGSGVTIVALGGLVLPMLMKEGYSERFSLGLVTAAGSLGLLFFPSLPVFLYSVVAGMPAEKLFSAGFWPGVLMTAPVLMYGVYESHKAKIPRHSFHFKQAVSAVWLAKWELLIPATIYVGFRSGWLTIVEAAALAALLAILAESWLFKDLSLKKDVPRVMAQSGALVGGVLIVLGCAMSLTGALVEAQIPMRLVEFVTTHVHSRALFLLVLNIMLLILGSVLEIFSAIVVLAPLLVPLGEAFQIDPLHLGVIFLANLELGFLFPPVGLNLLLSATRFQKPLPLLYRVAFPFLVILFVCVLIITYVPRLSLGSL